jgi:hypothetical protein
MALSVDRRAAAACVIAALAAAGCGGHGHARTGASTAAPAPTPTAVTISAPHEGLAVRGERAPAGRLAVALTVTGQALAGQVVRVDGRCAAHSCSGLAFADTSGRWSTRVRLVLPARTRRWTLLADYALTPARSSRARVTVAVHAPKRAARVRHRRHAAHAHANTPSTTQAQPSPSPSPSPTPTTPSAPAPSGSGRTLVLVGDSLAVGVRDLLPAALPGWHVEVLGEVSRPLAQGMAIVAGLDLPASAVLAVSLFTNDDPTHTAALQAAVRQALAKVGPRGCVVWATIARPPVNGVGYRAANALLARLAAGEPRLRLVPWAEQVAADPQLVGGDGVHATPAGYQLRAQLFAQAARSCP